MKKKRMITNIISTLIFVITLSLSGAAIYLIYRLGILPNKYFIGLTVGTGLIMILLGIFAIKPRIKRPIKIFIDFIMALIIGIVIFGLIYLNKTTDFLDRIKAQGYQTENYYVVVLDDSDYHTIDNIEQSTLGIYESDSYYVEALTDVNKQVSLETVDYEDYATACNDLLDGEVEAVLISSAYKSLVDEEIENFNDDTKIIYTVTIKIETEDQTIEAEVTEEPFNIYISGIDIYGNITSVSRSDVNMILTVNPTTHEILFTSIPRDFYVQLHGTTGYKDKLTHAGIYGVDMSIQTIEDLLDIDINYYVRVNFTTLIDLVDAIGGITIYSDAAFTAWTNHDCKFIVGNMDLDGACALAFSRERHAYASGDRHRVLNQQAVLKAILNKALSSKTLITKYSNILESLSSSFETSIPSDKIYDLINMQLDEMPSWTFNSYSVDGTGAMDYTYSYTKQKLYVMVPDYKTVEEAHNLITDLMSK